MKKLVLHGIEDITHQDSRLSYIGLDLGRLCNLRCIYCFSGGGSPQPGKLSLSQRKEILSTAKNLGAQALLISGEGEPMLDKSFKPIIEYANCLEIIPVVYSNGTKIDHKMAKFLYENNVTPVIKLESLNPDIHDFLTNVKGSHEQAMQAIDNLVNAGYEEKDSVARFGIAAVYAKQNLPGIRNLSEWAGNKGMKFFGDILSITQRASENEQLIKPELDEIMALQRAIYSEACVDRNEPCKIWKYGIIIGKDGDAKYCTAVSPDIGNICDYSLKELVERKNKLYPAKAGEFTCPVKESQYLRGAK